MAAVRPERPDITTQVAADAAAANSVPVLRQAVVDLTEAVRRLEEEVERLQTEARRGG